jgi:hypothetical protein
LRSLFLDKLLIDVYDSIIFRPTLLDALFAHPPSWWGLPDVLIDNLRQSLVTAMHTHFQSLFANDVMPEQLADHYDRVDFFETSVADGNADCIFRQLIAGYEVNAEDSICALMSRSIERLAYSRIGNEHGRRYLRLCLKIVPLLPDVDRFARKYMSLASLRICGSAAREYLSEKAVLDRIKSYITPSIY